VEEEGSCRSEGKEDVDERNHITGRWALYTSNVHA